MITIMLLGPSLGAVSGVSTHLNQLLQSALPREFRFVHFQVGSEGRAESPLGKVWRMLSSPVLFLAALLRERPVIVHLNTSLEPKSYWRDIVYFFLAKLMGKKVIYQVHGGALPQQFFEGKPMRTALLRRVLLGADSILLLAQEELRAYRSFAPDLKLDVVPNAIEIGPDVQLDGSADTAPLSLVYVGRLAENKGIFDIVEAVAVAADAGTALRVVIAGGGPDEASLKSLVKERGLEGVITFAGAVFGGQKSKVWRDADVFAFPTYHREGLPYSLLESMAARTVPVICAVGAIPDVMQDGVHGIFVAPHASHSLAEAIMRLDRDRDLLRKMAAACRERAVEYYSVERLAADFRRTYLGLLR
jgi:glycosyltransferase involved in cell wall biosynthesis